MPYRAKKSRDWVEIEKVLEAGFRQRNPIMNIEEVCCRAGIATVSFYQRMTRLPAFRERMDAVRFYGVPDGSAVEVPKLNEVGAGGGATEVPGLNEVGVGLRAVNGGLGQPPVVVEVKPTVVALAEKAAGGPDRGSLEDRTPALTEAILAGLRGGLTQDAACELVGVKLTVWKHWRREDPELELDYRLASGRTRAYWESRLRAFSENERDRKTALIATMFALKCRYGWVETQHVKHSGKSEPREVHIYIPDNGRRAGVREDVKPVLKVVDGNFGQ